MRTFTDEQTAAIERRSGPLFLSAGAGSGKTSVLVERFVRAVLEDEDVTPGRILAITFTDKAAGELRERVRRRFGELGAREAARQTAQAWVSTIHGFCTRVLRMHALAAALDPAFTVLDEPAARALRQDAFGAALAAFLEGDDPATLDLAAAWGPDALATAVGGAYDELRSQGRPEPRLPLPPAPDIDGPARALAAALPAAVAELDLVGDVNKTVAGARAALDRCGGLLEQLRPGVVPAAASVAAAGFKRGNAGALQSSAVEAYLAAHEAYRRACDDRVASGALVLLDRLLGLFGRHYQEAKGASHLDFEDLQLRTRDLLADQPAIRDGLKARFAMVMVDEFQDTNPLQVELLSLLDAGNVFTVGDELQAIYGFRHADVGGFRARRTAHAAQDAALTLTASFRADAEILHTLNAAFGPLHERYEELRPPADAVEDPDALPRVELLLTDAGGWPEGEPEADAVAIGLGRAPARCAEARAVARRLRELLDARECVPGEAAVLLRATTEMELYERALEDAGVPCLASGGRGYWARQPVLDLTSYLRALVNPSDGLALIHALASPLCGVSPDGLGLLRLASRASRRDPWTELRDAFCTATPTLDGLSARMGAGDRVLLEDFCPWFAAEREAAPRMALDVLLERVIERSRYDLQLLRLAGGRRRLANVYKLVRLASTFEAAAGRDARAFADHATAELEAGAREADAPIEAGEDDAVRLMTIHAAKGLEFDVVVVGDLGRRRDASTPGVLVDGTRVGVRLPQLGGARIEAFDYDVLKEERRAREDAEERRILHVAFTRARRRLILSGAHELGKPWPRTGPAAPALAAIGPLLPPALLEDLAAGDGLEQYEGPVRLRARRVTPEWLAGGSAGADAVGRAAPDAEAGGTGGSAPARRAPAGPADRPPPVATVSYSSLTDHAACGYRYYLERVLRLPRQEPPPPVETAAAETAPALDPLLRGTLVHELLERLPDGMQAPGEAEIRALAAEHETELSDAEVADIDALVRAFTGGALAARLAAAPRVARERRFSFPLDPADEGSPLVNGAIDVLATEADGTMLVIDYKTDRVGDADLGALVAQDYGVQRNAYALAALRAGAPRVEVVHCYLERAAEPVVAAYSAADEPTIAQAIADAAAPVREGRFPLTPHPHLALCGRCPGRDGLCPYPRELTTRVE